MFSPNGYVKISVNTDKVDSIQGDKIGLEISIEDTGIGIAIEKQHMIFDAFTQSDSHTSRQYGGTGLGLAITRRLVKILGGQIYLKSTPGKGSKFTVSFPEVQVTQMPVKSHHLSEEILAENESL
ncbi:MAG: ATP-binding protein [Microcoleaceae cyanobacterium MO_207.B10]|nr:ATP-binding protein [Microcoleaceae cyanobacterium MO_207.B10]